MGRKRDNRNQSKRRPPQRTAAWAPYNFVPLPKKEKAVSAETVSCEDAVQVPKKEDPSKKEPLKERPRHDRFIKERCSGYFDVTLTTETPTFIRGMLTIAEAQENKRNETTSGYTRHEQVEFFKGPDGRAMIPGSSLRGMLRQMIEIITYSKLHFVSDEQRMFFRAVAAERDDPLREPYDDMIGRFSRNVKAGYLQRSKSGAWSIVPAQKVAGSAFGKVKDRSKHGQSPVAGVKGLRHFRDHEYVVQYHPVGYKESRKGRGMVTEAFSYDDQYQGPRGILVCSGNMAETMKAEDGQVKTQRNSFALVGPMMRSAQPITIPDEVLEDYKAALTKFQAGGEKQTKEVFNSSNGMLENGRPVFYIERGGQIIAFGHTPNFRVPMLRSNGSGQAATPLDLVPDGLREDNRAITDMAEALFGFVRANKEKDEAADTYAGRITVSDAKLGADFDPQAIFTDAFVPKILGSPKPTTFQHYVEQPRGGDTPQHMLHHYGTPKARLRGHKLYWRQDINGIEAVRDKEFEAQPQKERDADTQHTKIQPVREGVVFNYRVHFHNLSKAELGALSWALTLGGDDKARHMIGMGKPFGMGVVKLDATLNLIDRQQRYQALFNDDGTWVDGVQENSDPASCVQAFKDHVQDEAKLGVDFDSDPRIRELMTMLQVRPPHKDFTYMQLEAGPSKKNEYRGRPALRLPSDVAKRTR